VNERRLVVSLPTTELRHALGDLDDVEFVEWDLRGTPPATAIDIVVPPYLGRTRFANLADLHVRLIQSQSIGYDGVRDALPSNLVYANAASVHETSTAELALALILASQRGIADFVRAQREGRWAQAFYPSLADRTVLLVGYGGVGRAIEARLAGFEVRVVRVARSERHDDAGPVHAIARLMTLLPEVDVVVVAVPLDESTTGLVDDAFLSAMSDDSLFVNVSRGAVADTDALVDHAQRGRLRMALDVTDPEPLPEGHPLFSLDNVLLSPHVGGASSAMLPRMAHLVREQITRLQRGEEPLNVVLRT
jgi:phosphoglycerate dehydrogenase-like enzyme